jgi:hypothetical protein
LGKRSAFKRVEKDFYRTIDWRAVASLQPFLNPRTRYAEPCWGFGDLESWLQIKGHECVFRSDVMPYYTDILQKDALELTSDDLSTAECVITNPPWSRNILHPMIEHLSQLKPTWLLFDSDWCHTKQSQPYMDYCTDIVSVGRLIWIPDTNISGKDNCSWYKFTGTKAVNTIFHPRRDYNKREFYDNN